MQPYFTVLECQIKALKTTRIKLVLRPAPTEPLKPPSPYVGRALEGAILKLPSYRGGVESPPIYGGRLQLPLYANHVICL